MTRYFTASSCFASFASSLTDAFAVGSDRGERLVASIEGESSFIQARAMKRGIVVLTAHTSGWHASGPVLAVDESASAILVMRKERDPAAAAVQELAREHLGARTLQLDGNDRKICQEEESVDNGVDGWCYVDATTVPPTGNPDLVSGCPPTEQRLVRFVNRGEVSQGGRVYITCAGDAAGGEEEQTSDAPEEE